MAGLFFQKPAGAIGARVGSYLRTKVSHTRGQFMQLCLGNNDYPIIQIHGHTLSQESQDSGLNCCQNRASS